MSNLGEAFELLQKYLEGGIQGGAELSERELELFAVLSEDLLRKRIDALGDEASFQATLDEIVASNKKWNRALGMALDSFYGLLGSGHLDSARNVLEAFLQECPSRWYRGHAETELQNMD